MASRSLKSTLLAFIIFLGHCDCEKYFYCSSADSFLKSGNVVKQASETKVESIFHFQVREKSQICLTRNNSVVAVELVSHEIDFPIEDHYSFGLPDLISRCECQCDVSSECRFPECKQPCFKKLTFGGKCQNSFGQICCSAQMVPSAKNFRAYRLSPPRHVLTFKLRQLFSGSGHSSETVFRVTGNGGAKLRSQDVEIFLRADFNFRSFDFEHELTRTDWILTSSEFPEKYFAVDKNFVNGVFERNPTKLGWFRPTLEGVEVPPSVVLSKSFDVTTTQCDAKTFDVVFHGMTSASDLSAMLKPIGTSLKGSTDVDVAKRVVRVKPSADQGR